MLSGFNSKRARNLNGIEKISGPIFYWMSRDQRAVDNWALIYAHRLAEENRMPLAVVFCLVPGYLGATIRQYDFMLRGLQEVEKVLNQKGISFHLLTGKPGTRLAAFLKKQKAGAVVTDFNPLRINRQWKRTLADRIKIPCYEVDAHNILPAWEITNKAEYAAHLFRRKMETRLYEFLEDFPSLKKPKFNREEKTVKADWIEARKSLKVDKNVPEVKKIAPGYLAGMKKFHDFLNNGLERYAEGRNDPTLDCQSGLSPYLHFGQISAQRVVLETLRRFPGSKAQESFIGEILIWRELAENFCYYNPDYDNHNGFPDWARTTLTLHRGDFREYLYTLKELEKGQTHDRLWNAAQSEMVKSGKMHGYLRMYWAKKILEWSPSFEAAQQIAIYLNDRYSLDGRDPNGYAGIAWSIGGVRDRPWFEREIFGRIRYMSYNGCRGKFNIEAYIKKVHNL